MGARCHKLHFVVIDAEAGIVETKCDSRYCGAGAGIVVLHRWRISDPEGPIETLRFRATERGASDGTV